MCRWLSVLVLVSFSGLIAGCQNKVEADTSDLPKAKQIERNCDQLAKDFEATERSYRLESQRVEMGEVPVVPVEDIEDQLNKLMAQAERKKCDWVN
ncbi:hypothetical protein [Pseudovibrio sp. Alg231-02]|uniref:hypothetical protein n=1 Tax=Pseudovibrio sp. Alg231-02 TaxID=1922223 RepID=UPI000D5546D9|nr:hypothetical protein [Pseudovibrio sp. Alg231-02]